VPNTALRTEITRLLASLHYQGIVDLDLRLDVRDGRYKLLDFNPRLGAQFRLLQDTGGIDVVLAQYLDLTGQCIGEREQVAGRSFLVENYDPIAALGYWHSGELGLGAWLNSLRGGHETAWFARDDLRPFALMCLRMGMRAVSRPFTGGATRAGHEEPRYRPGRAATRHRSASITKEIEKI
jgi:predicted ATP-grasp superfamily ATP-dependent carboligase